MWELSPRFEDVDLFQANQLLGFAKAKKNKQRKGLEGQTNLPQEGTVTGQAFPSSEWERAAFMVEPNYELDPDGDLVLSLNRPSLGYKNVVNNFRSEGMVKSNRSKSDITSI